MKGVLLTGAPGVGKTAVAVELARAPGTAAVDLDWLAWLTPDRGTVDDLIISNLEAVLPNLEAAGARRVVLARCVVDPTFAARIPVVPLTVIRLTAPLDLLRDRLRTRDTGAELEDHLGELETLSQAAVAATPTAIAIDVAGRSVEAIAAEVRRRAGLA